MARATNVGGWIGCLVLVAGCSAPVPMGQVEGVVQWRNRPLAGVRLAFIPEGQATAAPAVVTTNERGEYRLGPNLPSGGVRPGVYRVVVTDPLAGSQGDEDSPSPKPPRPSRFPSSLSDPLRSPLRVTIEAGAQQHPINLDQTGR